MWHLSDGQAKRFSVFVSIEVIRKSTGANLGGKYDKSQASFLHRANDFGISLFCRVAIPDLPGAPVAPDDDRFQFIAPYFPELKTKITVSVKQRGVE